MKYNEKKAAHVAAYFIYRAGAPLEILKLIKLMYLAERLSFEEYGEPITGDIFFSLPHGPILSNTLNHANYTIDSEAGGWETMISGREDNLVSTRSNISNPVEQLTQLSDADLELLHQTWEEFGKYSSSQLRNITHEKCEEWQDPNGSRLPITYDQILQCVGFDNEVERNELLKRIDSQKAIDNSLAS